jgi:hypothetical protein
MMPIDAKPIEPRPVIRAERMEDVPALDTKEQVYATPEGLVVDRPNRETYSREMIEMSLLRLNDNIAMIQAQIDEWQMKLDMLNKE